MSNSVSEVQVVTDSASDIPVTMARDLGITVVPCNVHFGERTYRDGVDPPAGISSSNWPGAPPCPRLPSQRGAFEEIYRRLAEETNQIISIHLPANLSATLNSAHLGARSLLEPDRILIGQVRAILGTHAGPGAVGVACVLEG